MTDPGDLRSSVTVGRAGSAGSILVVAPFARRQASGGSQRATTVAERLEQQGFAIDWARVAPRPSRPAAKLASLVRLEPGLVAYHAHRDGPLPRGPWSAAIAAHSYMTPRLADVGPGTPRVVDFHNLEWRHLATLAALQPPLRRAHMQMQSLLMRRFEAASIREASLSLFATEDDLRWARRTAPSARTLLIPNLLPRAAVEEADRVWAVREGGRPRDVLVHLGTLTYPPNLLSLLRFLRDTWPAILAARPSVRLVVVGRCPPGALAEIGSHPRVTATGFVGDPVPILSAAEVALLPLHAAAGSSLRVLFLALAGVPVIASSLGYRGLEAPLGGVADSVTDWVELTSRPPPRREQLARLRERTLALHADHRPWAALGDALREMSG